MKKKLSVLSFLFLMLPLVSAAGPIDGLVTALNWLQEFFRVILNFISLAIFDSQFYGETIYIKMLMFFIILAVTFTVLKKGKVLSGSRGLNVIISLGVSILSVRYLPEGLFNGILIPYGAFAVSIFVFLPFIIFFSFIHNAKIGSFGRKASIIVYGVVFIYLWLNDPNASTANLTEVVYWTGLGLLFITFIFDGQVHYWLGSSESRSIRANALESKIELAQLDIANIDEDISNAIAKGISTKGLEAKKKSYEDRLKNLMKKR